MYCAFTYYSNLSLKSRIVLSKLQRSFLDLVTKKLNQVGDKRKLFQSNLALIQCDRIQKFKSTLIGEIQKTKFIFLAVMKKSLKII